MQGVFGFLVWPDNYQKISMADSEGTLWVWISFSRDFEAWRLKHPN